jgi:heat shock protein HtpX
MQLQDYHAISADWRRQLKKNENKTRWVIISYIAIFIVVGFIADTAILISTHPQAQVSRVMFGLLTFKVVPYATLVMGAIAFFSVLIVYAIHDKIMLLGTQYHEITSENSASLEEKQLYNVVEEMKVAAGMQFMPKVYVIDANYMNAFASGYSERSAMVAITRGLLEKLDRAELQAVMAHELSHIRHHDIKLTLMVTVLSNIILLVIDMLFYSVVFGRDRKNQNGLVTLIIVLRYVLPVLTLVLGFYLSRTREFMADAGSVELLRDNEPMARALLKIHNDHQANFAEYSKEYGQTPHEQIRQASYLYNTNDLDLVKSLSSIFSTHPSIEDRLSSIGYKKSNIEP